MSARKTARKRYVWLARDGRDAVWDDCIVSLTKPRYDKKNDVWMSGSGYDVCDEWVRRIIGRMLKPGECVKVEVKEVRR